MKSEIKKLPKSQLEIKVSIPWEEWKAFLDQAVEEISKSVKIEGFRPGKAPRNMVEQRAGKAKILETAAEKAIQKTHAKIIDEQKIEALGSPKAEILKLAEGNDLEYKITVSVMPEIKINPWEEKIKKVNKAYKDKKIAVEESEVAKELERLAASRVKLVTVNREARLGDSVEIDFRVFENGAPVEKGAGRKQPLILGKGVFIPGFEENITGMKEGEEKEFEINFPENYHAKHLAGKPATFKVKMNLVQERQVPDINDDFAKSLGKFEKLEVLKKDISEGLQAEKKEKQKEQKRTEYLDKLIEAMEIDIPEILIHEELHKMIGELEIQLSGAGMGMDDYLAQIKKTREDLERDWEPQAQKRIKSALALEKIAGDREIQIESAKIEEEMNKTLQYYKGVKDLDKNIDTGRLYNYVKGTLTNEKVFELLESL